VNPVELPRQAPRVLEPLAPGKLAAAWCDGYARVHAHSPAPPHAARAPGKHALLAVAVHTAFYDHCPLILSPDAIWVTILQGLAQHCAQAGDDVRAAWGVTHEGKKVVTVARGDDYLDGGEHDWAGVVTEFSDLVGETIGAERVAFAAAPFSTSTPTDAVVCRVALLDCVQKFFELVFMCGCGIPWLALRGTADDWRALRARAAQLRPFGLDWWCDELEPVLDQFVAAAEGRPDNRFWQSMCNLRGASGFRKPISGWLQALYPYLEANGGGRGGALRRNEYLGAWREEYNDTAHAPGDWYRGVASLANDSDDELSDDDSYNGGGQRSGRGVALADIPAGLSRAPFTMMHIPSQSAVKMAFLGGLAAVSQDPATRALEVHTGWAVAQCRTAAEEAAAAAAAAGPVFWG
jgi:hypothetical protein